MSIATTEIICGECGVVFNMTTALYELRKRDHKDWFCPNGHCRHYPKKTDDEKTIGQLRNDLASTQSNRDFWRGQDDKNDRRIAAYRGQITRLKRRIVQGLCPFCGVPISSPWRHFKISHPAMLKKYGAKK